MVRAGATFADTAAEPRGFIEQTREREPSTPRDYRSCLKVHPPVVFGDRGFER